MTPKQFAFKHDATRFLEKGWQLAATGECNPDYIRNHTVYSLRHCAICMRIILSHGQVNVFNLAKNAGTSVEQIERLYARNLTTD